MKVLSYFISFLSVFFLIFEIFTHLRIYREKSIKWSNHLTHSQTPRPSFGPAPVIISAYFFAQVQSNKQSEEALYKATAPKQPEYPKLGDQSTLSTQEQQLYAELPPTVKAWRQKDPSLIITIQKEPFMKKSVLTPAP